jgi:hypothetical protein
MSQSQKLLGKFSTSPEIHKAGHIGGTVKMLFPGRSCEIHYLFEFLAD